MAASPSDIAIMNSLNPYIEKFGLNGDQIRISAEEGVRSTIIAIGQQLV